MKAPHMSKKMEGVAVVEARILLAAHNLKHQHPEAKHVRFYREEALHSIFRGHIATKNWKGQCRSCEE